MPKEIQGGLKVGVETYGIVISRFNHFITKHLLEGALDCLVRHGAKDSQITVVWAPGSVEIPVIAQHMAQSKNFDALICLAAVIRGQTDHYDYVCQQVSRGLSQVSLQSGVPAMFGVITADTLEDAINRAGAKNGNKGFNTALAAIELTHVLGQIKKK